MSPQKFILSFSHKILDICVRRTAAAVRFFSAGGLENGDICDMIKKIAIFRQNVE